VLYSL